MCHWLSMGGRYSQWPEKKEPASDVSKDKIPVERWLTGQLNREHLETHHHRIPLGKFAKAAPSFGQPAHGFLILRSYCWFSYFEVWTRSRNSAAKPSKSFRRNLPRWWLLGRWRLFHNGNPFLMAANGQATQMEKKQEASLPLIWD